jgi:hypothetical protein
MPIIQPNSTWNASIGIQSTNATTSGFIGDFREFFFANAYINATQISNVKN